MDPALQIEIDARSKLIPINEATQRGDSAVQQFYKGCTALVSGGSGFLGKQLIEKLIRSTDVKLIYLLLRPKKGKTVECRFKELMQDPVFETLHETKPHFPAKIAPLEGDLSLVNLGLGDQVWNSVAQEIDVIFHAAASVNFEEPVRRATLTNVRGTREMIRLARDCPKLRCMVYVSTLFSNATRNRINQEVFEQFYPAGVDPELMVHMAETMDEKLLNQIKPQLLTEWPNTYTFSKCIAETLIAKEGAGLPICIVRPGVVICSKAEPLPFWIDPASAYGPSAVVGLIGYGVMHVLRGDHNNRMDFIPVDLTNNAIIVAGWETARRWDDGIKDTKIYSLTNTRNPLYWHRMLEIFTSARSRAHCNIPNSVWYAFVVSTRNLYLYYFLVFHLHYLPGFIVDGILALIGKPRMAVKTYKKIDKLLLAINYFNFHHWQFNDDNTVKLYDSLSPTDRTIYDFDMTSLDWQETLLHWNLAVRKYILKDGLVGTNMARDRQNIFKILNYVVFAFYFWIYWKIFSFVFVSFGFC